MVALLAVFAFHGLARELKLLARLPATLAFACWPLFVVESASTMDYTWALAPLLGSVWAALRGRWLLAAVLLGLAAGCRPTSAAFGLPLAAMGLLDRRTSNRTVFAFTALSAGVATLCFSPLLWQYGGLGFLGYAPVERTLQRVASRTTEAVGLLPLLALPAVALDLLVGRGTPTNRESALLGGLSLTGFGLLLYLPAEPAYLLPCLAFGLLLVARLASPSAVLLLLLCAVGSLAWSGARVRDTWKGEAEALAAMVPAYKRLREAPIPPESLVLTGWSYPVLVVLGREELEPEADGKGMRDPVTDTRYRGFDNEEALSRAIAEDRALVVVDRPTDRGNLRMQRTSPLDWGAQTLAQLLASTDSPAMKQARRARKSSQLAQRSEGALHLLVILVPGLRPEHLAAYGGPRRGLPLLDGWAQRALRCELSSGPESARTVLPGDLIAAASDAGLRTVALVEDPDTTSAAAGEAAWRSVQSVSGVPLRRRLEDVSRLLERRADQDLLLFVELPALSTAQSAASPLREPGPSVADLDRHLGGLLTSLPAPTFVLVLSPGSGEEAGVLLLRAPGQAGGDVNGPARVSDLDPTVRDLVHLRPGGPTASVSLVGLWGGDPVAQRRISGRR